MRSARAPGPSSPSSTIPILAQGLPEAITGEDDPERALRKLPAPHARLRCVTMGAQGALLLDGDRVVRCAAPAVDVVDTTGAGDVFGGRSSSRCCAATPRSECCASPRAQPH